MQNHPCMYLLIFKLVYMELSVDNAGTVILVKSTNVEKNSPTSGIGTVTTGLNMVQYSGVEVL